MKVLRFDKKSNRAPSLLLKFNPGASYPNHSHPAGEEVYILEGEVRFGPNHLKAGDFLYTPPGAKHSVFQKKLFEYENYSISFFNLTHISFHDFCLSDLGAIVLISLIVLQNLVRSSSKFGQDFYIAT